MKRDMDLIRKMVLLIGSSPGGWAEQDLKIDGYTDEATAYHAYLLVDADLAVGVDTTHLQSNGPECIIRHLTWEGHDFADACRNESVWEKATSTIRDSVGSVTFDVMKDMLVGLLKGAVAIP